MLSRNTNQIILSIALDILCIVAAVYIAIWVRLNLPFGRELFVEPGLPLVLGAALILYPLIYLFFSIYDPERSYQSNDEFQRLTAANFVAGLALAGLVYFTERSISRLFLAYFYVINYALVIGWRFIYRALVVQNTNGRRDLRRVLLIGGGEAAHQAIERLYELAWAGVHMVGYLTDKDPIPLTQDNIPRLGSLNDASDIVMQQRVDDVLIALPAESYNKVQQLVPYLIDKPCNIWVVPDYFSLLLYGSRVENLGGVSMISLKSPTLTGYQRVVKRIFDLVVGGLTVVITLPLLIIISIAIKLDSPGPVLFKQKRVGENGRVFEMYKFRSMVAGADQKLEDIMQVDEQGNWIHKSPDDPRVTKTGRFIRRTSLDELPQIINVLKGEMSLVGPRPELPVFVANYQTWQQKRFAVPQGMTGWWQINGRSDKPMHLHTEDDLYYIQNYSLFLDIQIIFKTIPVVLQRRGAY